MIQRIITKIFISLAILSLSFEFIVIPFRDLNEELPKESSQKISLGDYFLDRYMINKKYSEVLVAEPYITVNFNINMNNYLFLLGQGLCFENQRTYEEYIEKKSLKYLKILRIKSPLKNYESLVFINEKFSFFNNLECTTYSMIDKFFTIYAEHYKKDAEAKTCGEIGLSLLNQVGGDTDKDSFLDNLKLVDEIKNEVWTYHYFDNENENKIFVNNKFSRTHQGVLVFGSLPHEYAEEYFSKEKYVITSSDQVGSFPLNWNLNFKDIYYLDQENNPIYMQESLIAELNLDLNYIQPSQEYFDSIKNKFFGKYLEQKICGIETINDQYEVIYCDKKKFKYDDMKTFPNIYFKNFNHEYIFSLNFAELFDEIDGKIVFLMVNNKINENKIWKFGKLLMKKYHFTFDAENRNIGFYLEEKVKPNKSNLFKTQYKNIDIDNDIIIDTDDSKKIVVEEEGKCSNGYCGLFKAVVIIALLVIVLIIGLYIGKNCLNKNRKKRANELEEEIVYSEKRE